MQCSDLAARRRWFRGSALVVGLTALSAIATSAAVVAEEPAAAASDARAGDEIELRENVEYGTGAGEPLTLHLAKPKNAAGRLPVIAYIHGGGWRQGNKDGHKDEAIEAAKRGYLSVSIGYRFAPKHQFPAQIEDVKCAIRWLRAHADELGIDPERIGAIGYSAGAHLSMMLGTMDSADGFEGSGGWADQSSKVQAVVAYFGPTNFELPYPAITVPIVEGFLGGSREQKPEAYKQASPVTYVNAGDAPTLIYQGTKDILVPYEQAFDMATALTKAGVPGRVELLLGLGHGWNAEEMVRAQAGAMAFFDQYLKSPAAAK
ncbi:MAG: alpha/beta hydrolase fold domain-containing protein [Pirellulales bacterium]